MQRRTSRNLSRAVVVAVILAVGATIWQSWTAGMPGMSGVVATQWGPLSPADRDLIVKVRLACLWEMSTGQQVQQQGTSPAVKEAGRKISAEHTDLDQKTRDIADKLGVPLPASPNAQQVAWMKEIAVQDRLGLRPDRRAAAARGPRDRAADPRGGADQHPQRRWSASSPPTARCTSPGTSATWSPPAWSTTPRCPSRSRPACCPARRTGPTCSCRGSSSSPACWSPP